MKRLLRRLGRYRGVVATANIRNNPDMTREQVRADARGLRHKADVILLQEIREREDHLDVRAGLGRTYRLLSFGGISVPIAYKRTRYKLLDADHIILHGPKAETSPQRFASYAVLKRRRRPFAKPVAFVNLHFVSGAWNLKEKPNKAWRQVMWERSWLKVQRLVLELHQELYTIIVGGDFNRLNVDKFLPSQRWLSASGIDKLAVIPGDVELLETTQLAKVRGNTDHAARRVQLWVQNRAW